MQHSRQIIFGILLLGLISVGSIHESFLVFGDGNTANHGDIGGEISSLEFSTDGVFDVHTVQVSGDIFAVVYVDSSGNGQLQTYSSTATGTVADVAGGATQFATAGIADPQIFHIDGLIYGILYSDNGKITINTFSISNDGQTIGAVTTGGVAGTVAEQATSTLAGLNPDIVHVSGAVGATQFFALGYTDSTDGNAGDILPISITADGTTIAHTAASIEIAASAREMELIKLDAATQYAAVYHTGTTAAVTSFDVTDAGTATVNVGATTTFALRDGVSINTVAEGITFDILHVSGTTYAVVYVGPADKGVVETFTISNADPALITTLAAGNNGAGATAIKTFGDAVTYPTFLETFDDIDPRPILIAYRAATDEVALTSGPLHVSSHIITIATGALSDRVDNVSLDTIGINPTLVHRDGDYYVLAYESADDDGFIRTVKLGAGDTTLPTLTSIVYEEDGDAGASPDFAKDGDTLKVTIVASEAIQQPTIDFTSLTGETVTWADSVGQTTWTATTVIPTGTADKTTSEFSISAFSDLAGNVVTADTPPFTQANGKSSGVVNIDNTDPSIDVLTVDDNGASDPGLIDFAKTGENFVATISADEPIIAPTYTSTNDVSTATITGAGQTAPSAASWTGTLLMAAGDTEGEIVFSGTLTDRAGNTKTFTQADITDASKVTFDKTIPTFVSANYVSANDLQMIFSEEMATDGAYAFGIATNADGSTCQDNGAPSYSGTVVSQPCTVAGGGDGISIADTGSVDTHSISDRAGNTVAAGALAISAGTNTPTVTGTVSTSVPTDSTITTIDASGATTPTILFQGTTPAANVVVTTPSSVATVTFPPSATVTGSTSVGASISTTVVTGGLVAGDVAGTIVELGDPDTTITFNKPVKVVLSGLSGKNPYFIATGATVATQIADCNASPYANDVAALADALLIANSATSACAYDGTGAELGDLIIWTTHFTGFGGSGPAAASTSSSGKGGSGSNSPPSLLSGFNSDEFPLVYDGVRYNANTIDSVHTSITEIGDPLNLTLQVYDNSGPHNIQHVEMYVNQLTPNILNDLSETIIIYDSNTGDEIIDPHNLISSATITPSVSADNKAVFDIEVIFNAEVPESYILFRIWDQDRSSMNIELEKALIVVPASESSSASESSTTSESSSTTSTASTPEPTTVIESGTVVEDGTVIAAGTVIEEGAVIESGVILEPGVVIESGVTIETGVVTDTGISLESGITNDQALITESEVVNVEPIEVVESGTIVQGTVVKEGTIIKSGVTVKAGVTLEPGVTIEPGVIIEKGVTTKKGIALDAGTTVESNMVTATSMSDSTKTYSPQERVTIEKWGGFSSETVSDIEVLYEFGIQGQHIPSWFKHTSKWYVNDQLDKSDLIDALDNLSKRGYLD